MIEPFELLKPAYLNRLLTMKKKFMVSQSYTRGRNNYPEAQKIDILVTDYDDLQYAQVHFNAVRKDKYASIIHLDKVEHRNKLDEMIHGEKYEVYWCVVHSIEGIQKRLDDHYADSLRRYITKNTNWRIKSDVTIKPKLEIIFGELFLILKYNSQTLRVKFEEIEKS